MNKTEYEEGVLYEDEYERRFYVENGRKIYIRPYTQSLKDNLIENGITEEQIKENDTIYILCENIQWLIDRNERLESWFLSLVCNRKVE
jgi:hypothetical protein